MTIGRALHNAVTLPSKDVSSLHLRIDWDDATNRVTVTDLSSATGTFVNGARLHANTPYAWDTGQVLRVGEYELKLIMPNGMKTPNTSVAQVSPASQAAGHRRRWALAALMGLLALAAAAAMIYGVLARPAEIVRFALTNDDAQSVLQFQVNNARRVELLVNDQAANIARFSFDPQSGAGAYTPTANDAAFELIAYNALNQPTRSRLSFPLPATPTATPLPTPTPRPTLTPQPNDIAFAEFSFNGVNKADDLSDIVLNRGEPLDIRWEAVNADSVELQPAGTFRPKDVIRVAPSETTVYTLIARNESGQASRSVRVIVVDAQATASADATASAIAQATQAAITSVQGQAAATATAASQATATAIAQTLAQAQAAAAAKATQDAQAVFDATATAAANATAQAQGTAAAQATLGAQASNNATATALAQATAQAGEARYSQYNGVWVNDDPTAVGVTRLVISNVGPTITAQAFARCQPQDCDWGARSRPFTGEPFTIAFEFGDGVTRQLTLLREGAKLRVTDADSRGPIRTYTFSARS